MRNIGTNFHFSCFCGTLILWRPADINHEWLVFELCIEIAVNTIHIGNYEFYPLTASCCSLFPIFMNNIQYADQRDTKQIFRG